VTILSQVYKQIQLSGLELTQSTTALTFVTRPTLTVICSE